MCKYCAEYPNTFLFNNRDKLGKKSNGYPGVMVEIDTSRSMMCIGAAADVYEPAWVEAEFKINFCPMCGEELKRKD